MKKCNDKEVKKNICKLGLSGQFNINDVNKILDIVSVGDKRLRNKNIDVDTESIESIYNLLINMLNTLYDSNGCGIAAPQVGENINLFMIEIVSTDEDGEEYITYPLNVFINPKIIEYSEEKNVDYEGCLSVGDFYAMVERSTKVKIEYTTLSGERVVEEIEGFPARTVQHEYDHLQGRIYTDIADMKTFTTRDNLIENQNSND